MNQEARLIGIIIILIGLAFCSGLVYTDTSPRFQSEGFSIGDR